MSSPEFKINVNLETTRQLLPPKEEKQQKFENAQAYKKARDCLCYESEKTHHFNGGMKA